MLPLYTIKFKDTPKTQAYFKKMRDKQVVNFKGVTLFHIQEVPWKASNLIKWYLNRNKYSHNNIDELLSQWYLTHKDQSSSDNLAQEVYDFMNVRKHMLTKKVFDKKNNIHVGVNAATVKEFNKQLIEFQQHKIHHLQKETKRIKEFLKADQPEDLDEDIYQRCRYYATILETCIVAGNSFFFATYEFTSYVYRHRLCKEGTDFNLQKVK